MKTVLQDLFGSRSAEGVLLYLYHYGEGYGRGIASDLELSLESVQRQLDKLEGARVLVTRRLGRTLVFSWNEKSKTARKVKDLVATVYEGIPLEKRAEIFSVRRRPRSKNKPVL